MELKEKLEMIEDMLELDEGTLKLETKLSDIEEWDSVAALSLIVMLDDEFGKSISGKEIRQLKTINEIVELMN